MAVDDQGAQDHQHAGQDRAHRPAEGRGQQDCDRAEQIGGMSEQRGREYRSGQERAGHRSGSADHTQSEQRAGDGAPKLIGFVHNRGSPPEALLDLAEHWLRTRPALFAMRPDLRRAVDGLVNVDAHVSAPSAGERRRFFDSVAELFRDVAKSGQETIIIDDLHNADAGTYQLLYHIAAATRDAPLLLVASERSDAFAPHPREASTSASILYLM